MNHTYLFLLFSFGHNQSISHVSSRAHLLCTMYMLCVVIFVYTLIIRSKTLQNIARELLKSTIRINVTSFSYEIDDVPRYIALLIN